MTTKHRRARRLLSFGPPLTIRQMHEIFVADRTTYAKARYYGEQRRERLDRWFRERGRNPLDGVGLSFDSLDPRKL